MTPVFLGHFDALGEKPVDIFHSASFDRLSTKPEPAAEIRMFFSEVYEIAGELKKLFICMFPVDPGNFIILAIGIVISFLRSSDFITRNDHRNTLRKQERGEEVPHLFRSKCIYIRIIGVTFGSAVPRA